MPRYELITTDDLIQNPSPRCACMVVLDTSSSMSGAPISELNSGFQHFLQALLDDEVAACSVEVSVITAGGVVRQRLPFTSAMNIDECGAFSAEGATPLGEAVQRALVALEDRKIAYRKTGIAYYQPWLVIISDGEPTDAWQEVARQARDLSSQRKLVSLAVGVQGANMSILSEFSHRPALKLNGLRFNEFFDWLSASMSRVSMSASTSSQVQLPDMDSWASI